MAYLFTPKGIEPADCFKTVRSASHQANLFAVANGVLDVATNNTVGLVFFQREKPELADKVEVIWTSPPLPEILDRRAQGPRPGDQGEDAPVLPDLRHRRRAPTATSSARC